MLISMPKSLGISFTFLALILLFLTRHHLADNCLNQTETGYTQLTSDQIILSGITTTNLQEPLIHDESSKNPPPDIEATWTATVAAKSLLQKVREFRIRTQPSYNDASKKGIRKRLEDAEAELETLEKESFDTEKIVRGEQALRAALKAAEEVMAEVGVGART